MLECAISESDIANNNDFIDFGINCDTDNREGWSGCTTHWTHQIVDLLLSVGGVLGRRLQNIEWFILVLKSQSTEYWLSITHVYFVHIQQNSEQHIICVGLTRELLTQYDNVKVAI